VCLCPHHKRYGDDGTFSYDYYIKIAITLVPNPYRAMSSSVLSSAVVRRLAAVSKKVRVYTFLAMDGALIDGDDDDVSCRCLAFLFHRLT
jgi:hypothetical protein